MSVISKQRGERLKAETLEELKALNNGRFEFCAAVFKEKNGHTLARWVDQSKRHTAELAGEQLAADPANTPARVNFLRVGNSRSYTARGYSIPS